MQSFLLKTYFGINVGDKNLVNAILFIKKNPIKINLKIFKYEISFTVFNAKY